MHGFLWTRLSSFIFLEELYLHAWSCIGLDKVLLPLFLMSYCLFEFSNYLLFVLFLFHLSSLFVTQLSLLRSAYFTYIFNIYSAHVNAKFGAKLLIFNVIAKFFSTFFQYDE